MSVQQINNYELKHELGSGAGGVVHYAFDTKLQRPVVLKMLHPGSSSSEAMMAKILYEARVASAIEHPNVCTIYDVNQHQGIPYIAMQYVSGQTLAEVIKKRPLNLPFALSIAIQIGDGLAEAHRLGILHRDLKPSNIMITEAGVAKILDFGLARRVPSTDTSLLHDNATTSPSSGVLGSTAYMAPEQFLTGQSTEQSDLFALGVIVYEMLTGNHPFALFGATADGIAHAIQYREPHPPRTGLIPPQLSRALDRALAKQPANRFASAAEFRDALKTLARTLDLEVGLVPRGSLAIPHQNDTKPGFFAALAERFVPVRDAPENSIVVLPFEDLSQDASKRFYGLALADAIATRIARIPSLVVRPTRTLLSLERIPKNPIEAGKLLAVKFVLTGSWLDTPEGFRITWQLLDVRASKILSGDVLDTPSLDLVAVQNEIGDNIFASLHSSEDLPRPNVPSRTQTLDPVSSDAYLQARGTLANFLIRSSRREDLDDVFQWFGLVLQNNPNFAHAHAGLGVAQLLYVRYGFGGTDHMALAEKHLEEALRLDPGLTEASVARIYILLAGGNKESAKQNLSRLYRRAKKDPEVRITTGIMLRLDGQHRHSLRQFGAALRLNPANAALIYNHRARTYQYLDKFDLAQREIDRGLGLDPRHSLLRTTMGFLCLRQNKLEQAEQILAAVVQDDPNLRIAYPTLAMCYTMLGKPEQGLALIDDGTRLAAEADGEMAYRLASFFAVRGDKNSALKWMRQAIYRGNHNYPWFKKNPRWDAFRNDSDFQSVLKDVYGNYRNYARQWKQLLPDLATEQP